jgi:biopolymer transport protein ExbB/TolQ
MIQTNLIELIMYQIGQLFLLPVLLLVGLMFAYSLYVLGSFCVQTLQRRRHPGTQNLAGYPLLAYAQKRPASSLDELDLQAHKMLEPVRLASRVAPMLGLVGTMIPMGPALKSLADGNLAQVSGNLTVAFSVVIIALIAASITYWIANVRRRWLAEEMLDIQTQRSAA